MVSTEAVAKKGTRGTSEASRIVGAAHRKEVREAMDRVCGRVAPTWPLDRFIAVNPLWHRVHQPIADVADELSELSGARLTMARSWYEKLWKDGRLRREHLREALERLPSDMSEERLVNLVRGPHGTGTGSESNPEFGPESGREFDFESSPQRRRTILDLMDSRESTRGLPWPTFVVQNVSQFCASYFDDTQASLGPSRTGGLYASFRRYAVNDRGPSILMGFLGFQKAVAALPEGVEDMVATALEELDIPEEHWEGYLTALLSDVNGWASWCAYLRWISASDPGECPPLQSLLAIRAAWEVLLWRRAGRDLEQEWTHTRRRWRTPGGTPRAPHNPDWVLQEAVEVAYQRELGGKLGMGFGPAAGVEPKVQAVFCIDVRSEVFRRAFEQQDGGVHTRGFAGFFGLPLEYAPVGADEGRPQLPGLLAPKVRVTDGGVSEGTARSRRSQIHAEQAWKSFRSSSFSSFAFVDSMGLLFAPQFLGDAVLGAFRDSKPRDEQGLSTQDVKSRHLVLTRGVDGTALSDDDRAGMAESMLRAMGLTQGFARLVLLVGHGSTTRNNPHAAGLDCGACCGQTGEVNARVAAGLLNDPQVRARLVSRGIVVPTTTWFVPGLHNTTTDEISLFDLNQVPSTHRTDLADVQAMLAKAGARARRERAPSLGLDHLDDGKLYDAVVHRSRNWSEVRPEWGLARNAAFIVAPRERTRGLDLQGRTFLHDYDFERDDGFKTLELIMTAPMVVTHWINFQYYMSTVDPGRYGSGNKVLHNVVGGHLGVFEGNGGDLRIGLSLQSVHDGRSWFHDPLRLSVFIEAPREAIDAVLEKHPTVSHLVTNGWIHLFQLDRSEAVIYRRGKAWSPFSKA